jgi:Mce-associated membrane protein
VTDDTRDVETTETAEAVEDDADEAQTDDDSVNETRPEDDGSSERTEHRRANRPRMVLNVKVVPVIVVLLLLISGGVTAWLYFTQYQPKQQTDRTNPAVAQAVVKAASDGTVALLSYSPESLDKDVANAKSYLSGDFLSEYTKRIEQTVAPATKEKSLTTTAHVVGAAVSELHLNSAVVLVFVDQSTTSKDRPDPSMWASSVLVSLSRIKGKWLITKFDPV